MKNKQPLAYLMAVGKSIIYGSSILFTGAFLNGNNSVMDVLALRFLLSAVVFLVLAAVGIVHINFS